MLIGRRDECRLLRELLDAVRADDSRSLNLLGERGMGKTALLEYAAGAARDVRVERASGVESEMGLAFATLHQLCAQMLDRVERLPEPQGRALATAFGLISGPAPDHFLVGLAVLGLLAETAADRPLLCVIDDVQWIDEASAHTLAFVARRVSAEPLGFLFAARQLRAELHGLPTLRLGGLDDHAARALLRSVVGSPLDEEVRDRVIAETRGNPLSLLEALGGEDTMELEARLGVVEARLPTGRTDEIIVGPLDQLSEDTRRLLVLAAAEPAGDPLLLLRASERLGIPVADLDLDGVLALEERVTFCQGLERSAVSGRRRRTSAGRSTAPWPRRPIARTIAIAVPGTWPPPRWCLTRRLRWSSSTRPTRRERAAGSPPPPPSSSARRR
ncbi:MAG TPA: ATP-binding protein [Thermoleophilaceae bacterium]|nr:ATP-binding protein [Thermoleophilaceae bacterium]